MLRNAISIIAAALCVAPIWAEPASDPAAEVLALERAAMEGWRTGNPDPQFAITDPQITFYHAVIDKRIEGLPALKALYEGYRGMPLFDSYEMVSPKAQVSGDVVVLTYQLAQRNGSITKLWNGTQVYQKKSEGWRVIHTHWSEAKRQQP